MTTERVNTITALTNFAVIIAIVGGAWVLGGSMARLEMGIENNAAAIAKLQDAVVENGKGIAENTAAIERLSGQFAEHIRRHEALASR